MKNLTVRLREAYGRKEDLSKIVAEQNKLLGEVNGTVKGLEREAKEVVYNHVKDNFERVGTVKGELRNDTYNWNDTYNFFYDKNRKMGVELYPMGWEEHIVSLWQDVDEEVFGDYAKNLKIGTNNEYKFLHSMMIMVGIPLALVGIPLSQLGYHLRKANEIRSSKKPHILEGREALFYLLKEYDIGKQQQCKKLD